MHDCAKKTTPCIDCPTGPSRHTKRHSRANQQGWTRLWEDTFAVPEIGQFRSKHPLPHPIGGTSEQQLGCAVVPGLQGCCIQQELPVHVPAWGVHPAGIWGQQSMILICLYTGEAAQSLRYSGKPVDPLCSWPYECVVCCHQLSLNQFGPLNMASTNFFLKKPASSGGQTQSSEPSLQ